MMLMARQIACRVIQQLMRIADAKEQKYLAANGRITPATGAQR